MSERKPWPRGELVSIGGPEMPMAQRVTRYRANVMAIRESGHVVPSAMTDTLDAAEIETWIRRSDDTLGTLAHAMRALGDAPDDAPPSS